VGNTDSIVRFPYESGDLQARGPAEHIADVPGGDSHWTRDIQFSPDGKKMFVSVGSASNVDDPDVTPGEKNRADVLELNPDGSEMRVFAYGIRNCVGLALIRRRASYGVLSTNATAWETTWFPTTSPTCRRVATTVGHGGTWAAIRTRGTPENIPS